MAPRSMAARSVATRLRPRAAVVVAAAVAAAAAEVAVVAAAEVVAAEAVASAAATAATELHRDASCVGDDGRMGSPIRPSCFLATAAALRVQILASAKAPLVVDTARR